MSALPGHRSMPSVAERSLAKLLKGLHKLHSLQPTWAAAARHKCQKLSQYQSKLVARPLDCYARNVARTFQMTSRVGFWKGCGCRRHGSLLQFGQQHIDLFDVILGVA